MFLTNDSNNPTPEVLASRLQNEPLGSILNSINIEDIDDITIKIIFRTLNDSLGAAFDQLKEYDKFIKDNTKPKPPTPPMQPPPPLRLA